MRGIQMPLYLSLGTRFLITIVIVMILFSLVSKGLMLMMLLIYRCDDTILHGADAEADAYDDVLLPGLILMLL